METFVLVIIIVGITVPVFIAIYLLFKSVFFVKGSIVVDSKEVDDKQTESSSDERSIQLKEFVMETYRSKMSERTTTTNNGSSTRSVRSSGGVSSSLSSSVGNNIKKYHKSMPKALNIDDNGDIV